MNIITSKLETEHNNWLNKIRSWESELEAMEAANGQIVSHENSKDVQKKVEHFQNQIIVQKGHLDEMKHNIKLYGGDLEKGAKDLSEYSTYYSKFKSEFDDFSGKYA